LPLEPTLKRTVVAVRDTFGYSYPNYDISALAEALAGAQGWHLVQTRFYTGLPDPGQAEQFRRDYRPSEP